MILMMQWSLNPMSQWSLNPMIQRVIWNVGTHYPDWTWPQDFEMEEVAQDMFQPEDGDDSEETWFAIVTYCTALMS